MVQSMHIRSPKAWIIFTHQNPIAAVNTLMMIKIKTQNENRHRQDLKKKSKKKRKSNVLYPTTKTRDNGNTH
jgi:hypothetical protein